MSGWNRLGKIFGSFAPFSVCAANLAGQFLFCLSVFAAASLAGCANLAGPEYQRPESPEKPGWSQSKQFDWNTAEASKTIQPDWWKNFVDPYLDTLIEKAISNNVDIHILAARIELARAGIGQAKAGALPTLSAGGGADHLSHTQAPNSTRYSLASEATWELDIWGKVRKGVEAQKAEFKATEADWRAGYLTLVSDVATTYFRIRQFDELSYQQNQTLVHNRQVVTIYEAMYREGLIPKTELLQQQAEIDRLETELLEFQRQRKIAENSLATLLGQPADTITIAKADPRSTVHSVEVPVGLPSQLLARRPDILAAEYRVLQSHNLSGQARLARLPSISLSGRGGTAAFTLGDLFKAGTFGLSSALDFPIFNPSIRANINISDAQTRVTEEQYRRTVISAFEEVENALTNLFNRKLQKSTLDQRRDRLHLVSEQIYAQLNEGMVSQLEVLESERSLLDAEQQLLINHWQVLSDTVALYKALGGGWPSEVVEQTISTVQ
jgi:NodT family efflux transporter outer membrane factor (OMF) lipoprotein